MKENIQHNAWVKTGFKVYNGTSVLAITRILTAATWSPIIWKDGIRTEENFLAAHYAALDFENPDVTIEDIKRKYCDTWHIIGTTRSHQRQKGDQPPMDRFRLLLKFERPILDLYEYRHNMKHLTHITGADKKCVDGARLFFPCKDIVSIECDEDLYDEEVIKYSREEALARRGAYTARGTFARMSYKGALSPFCIRWLLNVIPLHERNNTCLKLGCEMARSGMNYEEAVQKILASPTYAGKDLEKKLIREIRKTVLNGYKMVAKEMT